MFIKYEKPGLRGQSNIPLCGGQISMVLQLKMVSGLGVLMYCKISNSKHQITNKSQIPIFNDQNRFEIWNFGYYDLFDICDLEFLILHYSSILRHEKKTIEEAVRQCHSEA